MRNEGEVIKFASLFAFMILTVFSVYCQKYKCFSQQIIIIHKPYNRYL